MPEQLVEVFSQLRRELRRQLPLQVRPEERAVPDEHRRARVLRLLGLLHGLGDARVWRLDQPNRRMLLNLQSSGSVGFFGGGLDV